MVLLVLVICGTVMAAAARRSGQMALQATIAQQDIQFRWGASSCQLTLLPAAEQFLNQQPATISGPLGEASGVVVLGKMPFILLVSDETAKVNVNRLSQQYDRNTAGLLASIGRLQAGGRGVLGVELYGSLVPAATTQAASMPTQYESYEQVFAIHHPSELIGEWADGTMARQHMTLWGGGQVNLRRADRAVLREALAGHITESQLAALDRYRREHKDVTVQQIFALIKPTDDQAAALAPLVTEESDCHSLWVVAKGPARNWYRLYIAQNAKTPGDSGKITFAW